MSRKIFASFLKPKKASFIDKKKKGFYYENHISKKQTIDFISFSIHTIFIHIFNFLVIHGKITYRHYIMLPHEKYAVNSFLSFVKWKFPFELFRSLSFNNMVAFFSFNNLYFFEYHLKLLNCRRSSLLLLNHNPQLTARN